MELFSIRIQRTFQLVSTTIVDIGTYLLFMRVYTFSLSYSPFVDELYQSRQKINH